MRGKYKIESLFKKGSPHSLADMLGKNGYTNIFVTDTYMIYGDSRPNTKLTSGFHFFNRSAFDVPDPLQYCLTDSDVTDLIIKNLDKYKEGKFFLWAHYMSPHLSYENHPEVKVWGDTLLDRYDSEVSYVDHHIGRLISYLVENDLFSNTILIITADHGDELWERGSYMHGQTLFNEQVWVPLIIKVPEMPSVVIAENVSSVDLAPTLNDLIKMDFDQNTQFSGKNLLPLMLGVKDYFTNRAIFARSVPPSNLRAIIKGHYKLIYDTDSFIFSLYNMKEDPKELKNLIEERPKIFRSMKTELLSWAEKY
jgi:arylsulfatase A-like enzyme